MALNSGHSAGWLLVATISKKEWCFVALMVFLIISITAAPYMYGYLTAPSGSVYTGLHHLTPGDTNVFLSMIEQVRQGRTILLNLYTSEPQHELFINPLWLSVGWLARVPGISNLFALHLARSLCIAAFVVAVYVFISYFFRTASIRRWALAIVLFSSGLGVFFNPFLFDPTNIYEHPTDIWMAESITFLTLYHSPHLVASLTLIVLVFLLMLLAWQSNQYRYSISAGIAALFLLWFHPFHGPTIYATLGLYILFWCFKKRQMLWHYVCHYILLCIIPLPAVLYLFLISQKDWVISHWSAQNILPSPSVWMYVIGFGLLLIFAGTGIWYRRRQLDERWLFVLIWLITTGTLVYAPLAFQRRMIEGIHIPIALFSAVGICALYKILSRRKEWLGYGFMIGLFVFLPLTNVQIVGQDLYYYSQKKTLPYYLYQSEVEAMHWLRDNASLQEVTFSTYYMGNFIPAYSGRVVWIGHGPQTINLPDKIDTMLWFWQDDRQAQEKYDFLRMQHIDYVWYGRQAKTLGTYNPDTKQYLEQVFANESVIIYRVR